MNKKVTIPVFLLFLSFFFPFNASAIHKGAGGLVCGQCHTMHNSQGRENLHHDGTEPPAVLLLRANVTRRSQVHRLCLQCHGDNGAMANIDQNPQMVKAPKVYSSAVWNQEMSFNQIGAGGNFSPELDSTWDVTTPNYQGFGHSLGATDVTPPGGDKVIADFSCTNCHDPHGTDDPADEKINIFRNLRVKPLGRGEGQNTQIPGAAKGGGVKFPTNLGAAQRWKEHWSYVGGVNGVNFGQDFVDVDTAGNAIWPVFTGTLVGTTSGDAGKTNVYGGGRDTGLAEATMSKWCSQCHDDWHEVWVPTNKKHQGTGNGPGDRYTMLLDVRRHPVNSTVPRNASKTCAGKCHHGLLDRKWYTAELIGAGKGLPVTGWDDNVPGGPLVYYLPYKTPAPAGDTGTPIMDGAMDNKGHRVFCLTCHFAHGGPNMDNLRWDYVEKGSVNVVPGQAQQRGNPIEQTVGCQLCHNR